MHYNVNATQTFEEHYENIYRRFCELGFRSSAAELELRTAELIGTLATFPTIYPRHMDTHGASRIAFRYVTIKNYVVFYSVNEAEKSVLLNDIVYAKNIK